MHIFQQVTVIHNTGQFRSSAPLFSHMQNVLFCHDATQLYNDASISCHHLGDTTGLLDMGNKDAGQLRSNYTADQRLWFRYTNSAIPNLFIYIRKFNRLAFSCDCTGQFVSDLVGNCKKRLSGDVAHFETVPDYEILASHKSSLIHLKSRATRIIVFRVSTIPLICSL